MSQRPRRSKVAFLCLFALATLATIGPAGCADLPAVGSILVAAPSPPDPDFARTVILIVHSGEEGVMGLILNRTSGFPISHLFPGMKSTPAGAAAAKDPLYLGGFVAQGVRAVLLSASPPRGARPLLNRVWLILSPEDVERLARAGQRPTVFRAYAGYAGWSQHQLRKEVLLRDWRVVPGSAAIAFDAHPETLWNRLSAIKH